jgi:hypothetical protein
MHIFHVNSFAVKVLKMVFGSKILAEVHSEQTSETGSKLFASEENIVCSH